MKNIRNKFPMLKTKIVYLDSGALVLKPDNVIKAINDFYTKYSISNRTSDTKLGIFINQRIEDTRKLCAKLISCSEKEIIFNSGTTEGLNTCAQLFKNILSKNDEIIVSKYNHSSHMIPWVEIAKEKKAKIVFSENILKDINSKTKIIAFTQTYNNFNLNEDVRKIYKKANEYGTLIINDAAQAISHEKVEAKYFDAIAFSANKLFGPTGLGVLYLKEKWQKKPNLIKFGGGAIDYIKESGEWKSKDSIAKFEPGTLNLSAIFGFYESLKFFESIDKTEMQKYLNDLSVYTHKKLSKLKNVKIFSKEGDTIVLFNITNSTSQDVASYLGHKNIYVRSGFFCAQYLGNIIEKPLIRISLHIYNNKKDIDSLIKELASGGDFLDFI